MRRKWWFVAPAAVVGVLAFAAIGSWIVQELWNWLMPAIFKLPRITGVQALGLLALCRILFGGPGFMRGPRRDYRRHLQERWYAMTPEERERLREGLRGRCAGEGKSL